MTAAGPAGAMDLGSPAVQAVFGFTGAQLISLDDLSDGFQEDTFIVGLGYQQGWGDMQGWLYGWEAGLAGRFSGNTSLEAWGGLFARYNFELGALRVSPGVSFGLSAVTETMEGRETDRVDAFDGDGHLLFYLGPEISVGLTDHPNVELFGRLHHRSGAWGTLGGVHGAGDVPAVGIRMFF